MLASCAVAGGIHHSVVVVRDLEASLRFYRDGLGLAVLRDREVEGDWPALFGAPSTRLRAALPQPSGCRLAFLGAAWSCQPVPWGLFLLAGGRVEAS